MSLIPGTRYVRCRQGLGTIGSVAKTLEADPFTQLEINVTGAVTSTSNADPVYYVANNDTTDNDITD